MVRLYPRMERRTGTSGSGEGDNLAHCAKLSDKIQDTSDELLRDYAKRYS